MKRSELQPYDKETGEYLSKENDKINDKEKISNISLKTSDFINSFSSINEAYESALNKDNYLH